MMTGPNFPNNTQDMTNARQWFALFLIAHLLLWILGPALLRYTLPHDTLEGIAWGSQWQWGYNKHPFLAAWLSYGASILANAPDWPVYILAQLAVVLTFWAVWRLALAFLSPKQALLATLSLEGVFSYNLTSYIFTPDTLQSPLWALLVLFFYRALTTQSILSWLGVGIFAALSIVTKYQAAILFLPMLLLLISSPKTRISFKKPGIYLGIVVGLALITPHLIWLYQHQFITLQYAFGTPVQYSKTPHALPHLFYPANFILSSIGNTFCVGLLLWPIYRSQKSDVRLTPFQWQFLLLLGLGPWFISLILCMTTGTFFPARWATPDFFLLGVLGVCAINPRINKKSYQQFLVSLAIFMGVLWAIKFGMLVYANTHKNDSDAALPNKVFAQKITQLWHERYHTPLPYIAGSRYLVSALAAYSPDRPIPYFGGNDKESPWIDERAVHQQGAIIVLDKNNRYAWDEDSTDSAVRIEKTLRREFSDIPSFIRLESQSMSRAGTPLVIWVSFIAPHSPE